MREIYTITTLKLRPEYNSSSRAWGWYSTFKQAEKAVKKSADFFWECGYYDHIVIERMEEGCVMFGGEDKETWYELEYNEETDKVKVQKLDKKPDEVRSIVNFSLG